MTTDQLDETEQVEETGAQVGDNDADAGGSRDTDGHTEAPVSQEPDASDEEDDRSSAEPTDSVVTSDSSADGDGKTDVEGTDGAVSDVSAAEDDEEDDPEQQEETLATDRFEADGLTAVPAPEAEGEKEVDLEDGGVRWLNGLFERMDLDISAEFVDETDDRVTINLAGDGAERLLGRGKMGPKALEAVETILSRVFGGHPRSNDIYLDVGGARQARTERLQRVADDLADRAVELSKNVTISGLNSSERRVIHHQLRDDDRVETESVGEGIFRRLKIEPRS